MIMTWLKRWSTFAVLTVTMTISTALSERTSSDTSVSGNDTEINVMLQLLNDGNLPEFERLMNSPVALATIGNYSNLNSSALLKAEESLNNGFEVSPNDEDFGWIVFSQEDLEKNRQVFAYENRARSLTKLTSLHCKPDDYSLVTVVEGTYVQIMSPGYPNFYKGNFKCGWKIMSNPGRVIRILCPIFKLGRGDFTLVKDYETQTTRRFNASSPMKNFTTESNKMFLGFKSDADGEVNHGFLCLARSLSEPKHVGVSTPTVNSIELEVPELRKRSGQPFKSEENKTIENATDQAAVNNAGQESVTVVPELPSVPLLKPSSDVQRRPSEISGDYLQELKQKRLEDGIKLRPVWINKPYAQINKISTYTVKRGSSTYDTTQRS